MLKLDVKKTLAPLYTPTPGGVQEVEVAAQRYLMIDGCGDPATSAAYADAVAALFAVSYAIKFQVKRGPLAIDYGVMPLEGLWWAEDPLAFASADRRAWQWTAMILQPACVTDTLVDEAIAETRRKKALPALDRLRSELFTEGRCAQILHVGPFATEAATIAQLHAYLDARGGRRGKHHEIYLSDPRRVDPAKWKTLLRQGMVLHDAPMEG